MRYKQDKTQNNFRQLMITRVTKEKEEILLQFESSMDTESTQSQGLFTYHGEYMNTKEYVIAEYTFEIRRQLRKFISPKDTGKFHWTQRDGQQYYDFVDSEGESHSLSYHFECETETMRLYLDQNIINTVELDLAIKTTLELELYAELWLLQYLKDANKQHNIE